MNESKKPLSKRCRVTILAFLLNVVVSTAMVLAGFTRVGPAIAGCFVGTFIGLCVATAFDWIKSGD